MMIPPEARAGSRPALNRPEDALRTALLLSLIALLPALATAADRAPGERLFAVHCSGCHGPNGEGSRGPTLATAVLPRVPDRTALIKLITTGIPGTEMPRFQLAANEVDAIANWVLRLGQVPEEPLPGDPLRGEQLYREKGNCSLCHQLHGYGGAVGPELTDVGRRRGVGYLRRALVDPGADVPQSLNVPQNFVMVDAVPLKGDEVYGVRLNEDTYSVQIRDLAGKTHSFFKSELRDLRKDWGRSPMPSYAGPLSPGEINDIVAFLVQQKG
jgi:putative heme-binding domain-containing protein